MWACLPLLLVALLFGWNEASRAGHQRARASWKTTALEKLAGLSLTNEKIICELEEIKESRRPEGIRCVCGGGTCF